MTWILIVVLHVSYGAVVTMQEFNTKGSCETAGKIAINMAGEVTMFSIGKYECVQK